MLMECALFKTDYFCDSEERKYNSYGYPPISSNTVVFCNCHYNCIIYLRNTHLLGNNAAKRDEGYQWNAFSHGVTRCGFAVQFGIVLLAITGMLVWVEYFPSVDYLGVACMTFNIINFGAPLAGLGVVLRRRCCDTLPLPMCIVNLLVSSQWFLYGNIVHDPYVMAPNGIGMGLAVLQLSLFVIFPRKERGKSLLSRIIEQCISNKSEEEKGYDTNVEGFMPNNET
uniref:Sugar transporter SWEET n=1 Tax=Heterorhabditis bacteriophora TaxID=37862 RepID=A0A1I7XVP4_HETBA